MRFPSPYLLAGDALRGLQLCPQVSQVYRTDWTMVFVMAHPSVMRMYTRPSTPDRITAQSRAKNRPKSASQRSRMSDTFRFGKLFRYNCFMFEITSRVKGLGKIKTETLGKDAWRCANNIFLNLFTAMETSNRHGASGARCAGERLETRRDDDSPSSVVAINWMRTIVVCHVDLYTFWTTKQT